MQDRRDSMTTVTPEKPEIQRQFEPKLPAVAEPYAGYRGEYKGEDGALRFADYWRAIRKRLWLVIGIVVLIMTLTAIYMARRPDEFVAVAQVQVDLEQKNPDLMTSERRAMPVNNDPAYFNTQLQILNSPSLLRRVVKEINLESNKDFQTNKGSDTASPTNTLLRALGLAKANKKSDDAGAVPIATSSSGSSDDDLAEAKRLSPFVEALQKRLVIEPVRENRSIYKETHLIDIAYQHTNPELAALIVNTIADVFSKSNQERKFGTNVKTNSYLRDRIADLQSEVKRGEEQFASLQQRGGIIQLDEQKTLALAQLQGLNEQLLKAQENRKSAEAALKAASAPNAIEALMQSSVARKFIDDTKIDIDKLEQKRQELSVEYQEAAPEMNEIDRQITSRKNALVSYQKNAVASFTTELKTRYEAAANQEKQIQAAYEASKSQAQVQNNAGINIKLVEQKLNSDKETLVSLQKNSRENDITAAGTENNISVADVAIPPDEPVGPRRLMSVMVAGFLATLFGCGLALFLEYLDDSVKTTEDVENVLRLPALAVIPTIDSLPRRKLIAAGNNGKALEKGNRGNEVLITNDSRSALAEAYRQLRTSILLSTAGQAPKSLLVTSSVPSEGKTTTAINTAISLAQTGAKVLIIDADMRRPRLHAIFGVTNDQGLSSILSSKMNESEILNVIQHDAASNLYLLPSGAVPPNPAELIGSPQMQDLLHVLEDNFAHVVVDSPPIASFTDGVLIAAMVNGVLLVVHSGKSSRIVVKRAKQLLSDVGAKIFGVVLNNVNVRSNAGQYNYQNYYNSYYNDSDNG